MASLGVAVAFALAMGGVAPLAAYGETGNVTVEAIEGNISNTYRVFQVFVADISERDEATHIAWNRDAEDVVLAFLDTNGYTAWLDAKGYDAEGARENAQNAAEFIAECVGASPADAGADTDPETKLASSFSSRLAQAIAQSGLDADTAAVGEPYSNAEGYYLIVTDPDSVGADEAATAPIWLALGGSVETIVEKSALPKVEKSVKGVGDAEFSRATDAFTGQDLDYRLVGTMPSNIGAFGSYHYKFTDTMSGIDLQDSSTESVTVSVGDRDITSRLRGDAGRIAYQSGVLTVDIADVLSLADVDVDKNTRIVVGYRAHNTSGAGGQAGDGGTNSVAITYTADPVSGKDTTTAETSKQTRAYSYKIDARKIDKSNKQPLAGARFTVQLAGYDADTALVGAYVQADGSLGDEAHVFESAADGSFEIRGLDAGTYTVVETEAPEGYERQDADITLTIASTIDGEIGELDSLRAEATGGEAADVAGDAATRVDGIDKPTGTISMLVADDRTFVLAQTGLEGLSAHAAIAAALAAMGITGAIAATHRGKRRDR